MVKYNDRRELQWRLGIDGWVGRVGCGLVADTKAKDDCKWFAARYSDRREL